MHAKKYVVQILFAVLITAIMGAAVGAERHYCRVGADPVDENIPLDQATEMEVALQQDMFIPVNSGSGKVCQGWHHQGEIFVVSKATGLALRKRRCGNKVMTRIYLAPPRASVAHEAPPARIRQVSATPIDFDFRTNPEAMEPYDDNVGATAAANRITEVAVGVLGSMAIGYGISRSGDRITNNSTVNNGGTIVAPPPGPGHGGSTNPPQSPLPGYGGSTNPPTVEDPPFVYPGDDQGTSVVVEDPPFVYPGHGN